MSKITPPELSLFHLALNGLGVIEVSLDCRSSLLNEILQLGILGCARSRRGGRENCLVVRHFVVDVGLVEILALGRAIVQRQRLVQLCLAVIVSRRFGSDTEFLGQVLTLLTQRVMGPPALSSMFALSRI